MALMAAGCAGTGGSITVPGSSGDPAENADGGKISVVTTIFPPYDFVREIAWYLNGHLLHSGKLYGWWC